MTWDKSEDQNKDPGRHASVNLLLLVIDVKSVAMHFAPPPPPPPSYLSCILFEKIRFPRWENQQLEREFTESFPEAPIFPVFFFLLFLLLFFFLPLRDFRTGNRRSDIITRGGRSSWFRLDKRWMNELDRISRISQTRTRLWLIIFSLRVQLNLANSVIRRRREFMWKLFPAVRGSTFLGSRAIKRTRRPSSFFLCRCDLLLE